MPKRRIALVHDSFTQWGGAERVAAVIHGMFPEAPIYTLAIDPHVLPAQMRGADFRPSFLQGLPGMPHLEAFKRYLPLLPLAAESLAPKGFDLVISSSSAFAHGATAEPQRHVAYIHNTMRFAWDYDDYVAALAWPRVLKIAGRLGAPALRAWDRRAGRRPGRLVANSRLVAQRVAERWGRTAGVLPPPVDLSGAPGLSGPRRYFSVVSRLVAYKRVDLAIHAANLTRLPLIVVGDGPDRARLSALAGPTVRLVGALPEPEKWRVLGESIALISPGIEDFGIAPVEANAAGTPVIAPAAGGALESQQPGVTAFLTPEVGVDAYAAAMRQAMAPRWDRAAIAVHAQRFCIPAFCAGFASWIA